MAYDPKKNRRIALTVSLALAGIAFAAFLLLRRDDREVETTRTEADKVVEEEAPTLARSSGPARSRRGTADEGSGRAEEGPATVSEEPAGPPLEGLVLDDETGKPIEGAIVLATTASPEKTIRRDLLFQGGELKEGRIVLMRLA